MRTRNAILLIAAICMCTFFLACSGSETEEEIAPVAMKMVQETSTLPSGYSPLGIIPQAAKSKMSDREIELWTKIGQKCYVNYSFLDSAFYKDDKDAFLKRYEEIYEESIKNDNDTALLVIATARKKTVLHKNIRRLASKGEKQEAGWYISDPTPVWTKGIISVMAVGSALYYDSETYIEADHQVYATPADAKFQGEHRQNMKNFKEKIMTIVVSGSVSRGTETYHFAETVKLDLLKR